MTFFALQDMLSFTVNTLSLKYVDDPSVINLQRPHIFIGLIINKYWDLLQLSQKGSVKYVHEYKPILAFKRPKNLCDFLVHSSFKDKESYFSQSCDRRRCSHCKNVIHTDDFTSNSTQNTINLRFSTDCTSQNLSD